MLGTRLLLPQTGKEWYGFLGINCQLLRLGDHFLNHQDTNKLTEHTIHSLESQMYKESLEVAFHSMLVRV